MRSAARTGFGLEGVLTATIVTPDPDGAFVSGVDETHGFLGRFKPVKWSRQDNGLYVAKVTRHNAFVNKGLEIALDRLFGISGPPSAVSHIAVSSDNTAVTAGTTTLGGTTAFKSVGTPTRSSQTVTAGATFTQADVSFSIRKVALLNTATDAGSGLIDVIGGAGSTPYNQAFTIDLTGTSSFSLVMQIQVTASAV